MKSWASELDLAMLPSNVTLCYVLLRHATSKCLTVKCHGQMNGCVSQYLIIIKFAFHSFKVPLLPSLEDRGLENTTSYQHVD